MEAHTHDEKHEISKNRSDWLMGALKEVNRSVKRHYATEGCDRLVELGCNRDELLANLILVGPYATTADVRGFVFDRHEVKTVVKRLRQSAKDVARFLARERSMPLPVRDSEFEKLLSDLPAKLHLCAAYILAMSKRKEFKPRFHFYRDHGIAALVNYVKVKTGHFHDNEVSSLISAILNRERYHAKPHADWRRDHRTLVSKAHRDMPLVPSFRPFSPKRIPNIKPKSKR